MMNVSSEGLAGAVFTRKAQVNGKDGKPIAEVKGAVRRSRSTLAAPPSGGSCR
jgi:hypothetical protein